MIELTTIIRTATTAIERGYFHLEIDGGDPVYRERVYCYELYHQMRVLWPVGCEFYLNGEVDKAAHPILRKLGGDRKKPDLLVHKPGYMIGNHAIIEVKNVRANKEGIRKDIETLDIFVRKVGYQRAVYLFFGHDADKSLIDRIQSVAADFDNLIPIEIWFHNQAGQSATHVVTLQRSAKDSILSTKITTTSDYPL